MLGWTGGSFPPVGGHRFLVPWILGSQPATFEFRVRDEPVSACLRDPEPVVGAHLVAPADVDRSGWPAAVAGFRPVPMARSGLESTVVVSRDDPWVTAARARQFAEAWGSRLVDAGAIGHLDSNSQLGAWPEGWRLLEELTTRCGLPPLRPGPEADIGPFG